MEPWEHQVIELKSSLKSKDNTILRLRKCIEVYKKEFSRREEDYQIEILNLRGQVSELKGERKSIRSKVKQFVKLKRKEMKTMKKQLRLLEKQQKINSEQPTITTQPATMTIPVYLTPSQTCVELNKETRNSRSYLKQLETEYITQIDRYKELLEYENNRLKQTRQEFIQYVTEKTSEIDSLQKQIRELKDYILSTNSELNLMTQVLPKRHRNNKLIEDENAPVCKTTSRDKSAQKGKTKEN